MSATSIEWCSHVWNPFTGCDRVSPGCAHCYAADVAAGNQRRELGRARVARDAGKPAPKMRYQRDGDAKTSGPGFGFTVHWDKLLKPERFPVGARVFVNSMSDVFHEDAPDEAIAQLFATFANRPDVDWLILTKRPERMRELLSRISFVADVSRRADLLPLAWPLPCVWLGVTIENRRFVHRADLLRQTPAAVRWVSAEPLLGPLVPFYGWRSPRDRAHARPAESWWMDGYEGLGLDLDGIDWLVTGGESGPRHRRFDPEWARDLRDACQVAGTRFFMKQMGGRTAGSTLEQLPEDLRIRELPAIERAAA